MSTNAIPMTDHDRAQLQELIRRLGDHTKAAAAAKVNITTYARALAGLPVQPVTVTHIRHHVAEALARTPSPLPVTRHG